MLQGQAAWVHIGEVARRLGLRTSAIRYYEKRGLIESRRGLANGYRLYSAAEIDLLRFLKRTQALGLTLREAKELLEIARDGKRPCRRVRALARSHVAQVERRIRELEALRSELQGVIRRNTRPNRGARVCPLIES